MQGRLRGGETEGRDWTSRDAAVSVVMEPQCEETSK